MPTGYEVKMYNDINRIANCLEAAERRARERDEKYPRPLYDPEVAGLARGGQRHHTRGHREHG